VRQRNFLLPAIVLGVLSIAASPEYEVEPGDTLSEIAVTTGTTTQSIVELNALSDQHHIVAGQTLRIPAAPADAATSPATPPATPEDRAEVGALIDRIARANGWSPAFVKALAWQESGWGRSRVSSAGAIGVMQVMPATGEFISTYLVGRDLDLHDPEDNVVAGVAYLQHLWDLTGGDPEATLAGYYQGRRSVALNGRYADTDRYIANVLALRERFR
jgi:N-acetylmuramoyl-L-alanine amidase